MWLGGGHTKLLLYLVAKYFGFVLPTLVTVPMSYAFRLMILVLCLRHFLILGFLLVFSLLYVLYSKSMVWKSIASIHAITFLNTISNSILEMRTGFDFSYEFINKALTYISTSYYFASFFQGEPEFCLPVCFPGNPIFY